MRNHLVTKCGYSKSKAIEMILTFQRFIEKEFWRSGCKSTVDHNEKGVFMRVLGVANMLLIMFPYFYSHIGDEPGQKKMCGMYESNTSMYCIQCTYTKGLRPYNKDIHIARNADEIKAMCTIGELATTKKYSSKQTNLTEEEKNALKWLQKHGIHPATHPFHDVPMGYKNSLYKAPYDLLHTFAGGIMKSLVFSILVIVDRLSKSAENHYISGIFDNRLACMPSRPKCLPHVDSTSFKSGMMRYISSKTNQGKSQSTGSMGGMRSKAYVILLLLIYFVLGDVH
jgi:hypothetical protein